MKRFLLIICVFMNTSFSIAQINSAKLTSREYSKRINKDHSNIIETIDILNNSIPVDSSHINLIKQLSIIKSKIKEYNSEINNWIDTLNSSYDSNQSKVEEYQNRMKRRIDSLGIILINTKEDKNKIVIDLLKNQLEKYRIDIINNVELNKNLFEKDTTIKGLNLKIFNAKIENANKENTINKFKEDIIKYKDTLLIRKSKLDIYEKKNMVFGIAFGFSNNSKGQYIYKVLNDSTLAEYNYGKGWTGILSAVVSFKIFDCTHIFKKIKYDWYTPSFNVLLNIPLTNISFTDKEKVTGIFNQKTDLGLGITINFPNLWGNKFSLGYFINSATVKRLDKENIKGLKFSEETYSEIDISKYPAFQENYFFQVLAIVYNF